MQTWQEPTETPVAEELRLGVGGSSLVAQVLARRGIQEVGAARAFLNPAEYTPAAPSELPGMETAVQRVLRAIHSREPICVWGDFDVDGQTATTLLYSTLRDLGAQASYYIPVRARESHGISLAGLAQVLDAGARLVLTCDTGISAFEAADFARQRGVDLVITDHHDLSTGPDGSRLLPQAYAVVNPKLQPEGHPLGTLPGVGVAYKLAEALYEAAGRGSEVERHLDLVALGIVADVALITQDTRYLLQRGLQALRNTQRLGLKLMLELAEVDAANLTEDHIGFVLGPRLNAIGRLGDANPVVELLTTSNRGRAQILALEMEGLNARRKLLTDQVFAAAQAQIEREPSLLEEAALVLSHPEWPAGVVGIVASRLVEHYHRPVVLIAAPQNEVGRGSARSVDGVNITAALAENSHLLVQFGGHPMAAGLAILPERISELRRGLGRSVQRIRRAAASDVSSASLQVDSYVRLSDLTLELVADLERLAPFGAGNPPVVLASRDLSINGYAPVGRNDEHMLITVEDEMGTAQRVIWWQGAGWGLPEGRFDLAFTAHTSNYRGRREVQVEWIDARPIPDQAQEITQARRPLEVLDYRQEAHPLPSLQRVQAEAGVQVWREGEALGRVDGVDRTQIQPSETLVIWNIPPGDQEMRQVLERAAPRRVVLFGAPAGADEPQAFLQRLAGLVKFAINQRQGQVEVAPLAAATAQREATVRAGLAWLASSGYIQILQQSDDRLLLAPGDGLRREGKQQAGERIKSLLAETAAYRAHYLRAQANSLLEGL